MKHLWSHQLNYLSEITATRGADTYSGWVGKLSNGSEDYSQFSCLGAHGLKMINESLYDDCGAFVMWCKGGHNIFQENKAALLDLIDALCCNDLQFFGLDSTPLQKNFSVTLPEESKEVSKIECMFKIEAPRKNITER